MVCRLTPRVPRKTIAGTKRVAAALIECARRTGVTRVHWIEATAHDVWLGYRVNATDAARVHRGVCDALAQMGLADPTGPAAQLEGVALCAA